MLSKGATRLENIMTVFFQTEHIPNYSLPGLTVAKNKLWAKAGTASTHLTQDERCDFCEKKLPTIIENRTKALSLHNLNI